MQSHRRWKRGILFSLLGLAAFVAPGKAQPTIATTVVPDGGVGGDYSATFTATGGVGSYTWAIVPNAALTGIPPNLNFDPATGSLFGSPSKAGTFSFQLQATDTQVMSSPIKTFTVTIYDIATSSPLPPGSVGSAYFTGLNATSGFPTWSLTGGALPTGNPPFTLTNISGSGLISGTPDQTGTYTFVIQAVFPNGQFPSIILQRQYSLDIGAPVPPLQIGAATLPTGMVGAAYPSTTLTATGGTGTGYVFSVTGGSLGGLTLSPGGTLSGTPTSAVSGNVNFQLMDSAMATATRQIPLTIVPTLTITTSSLPTGSVGTAYPGITLGASGGSGTGYTFSVLSGSLGGLSLVNGTIGGTPTSAVSNSLQLQVTDSLGFTATRSLTLTIVQPLTITTKSLNDGMVGRSYSQSLGAAGGQPGYSFTALSALPAGMNLTSGVVGGTPTAAFSGTIPFQVTDSASMTATATLSITIYPALSLTTATLPAGTLGIAYSQNVAAAGGLPPYLFSAVSGLPAGLSVSDSGAITGTPTAPGTTNITFQVSDFDEFTATRVVALTVVPPLQIVTQTLPDGYLNTIYNEGVAATGGVPPYTFTIQGSSLPPGLSLNGIYITGTPTQAGGFAVQLNARDSQGRTDSRSLPIRVNATIPPSSRLQVQPSGLSFTSSEGGGPTAPQDVIVTSTSDALSFTLSAGAGTGMPSWLSLTYQPGLTPAQIRVRAVPGSLTAGIYQTKLHLTSTTQSTDVPISFTVNAAAPQLSVAPTLIQRSSRDVNPTGEALISLRNTGGGLPLGYSVHVVSSSPWITIVRASSNELGTTDPVVFQIGLSTSGLRPGVYRDELRIDVGLGSPYAQSFHVPITLFNEGTGPALEVSAKGLRFPLRQFDPLPTRSLQIFNHGTIGTSVNWTAALIRGSDTFTLSSTTGTATTAAPSTLTLGLKPGTADTPGSRSALLRISDSGAFGSPEYVVLVADVSSAGSAIDLSTAGLVFLGNASGADPASQTISLASGGRSLEYSATTSTSDGGAWLRVGPASGVTRAGQDTPVAISVASTGLAPGVYNGLVTIGAGGDVRGLGVTFIVLSSITGSNTSVKSANPTQPHQATLCLPAKTAISQTTLAESFSVPAGWPATISVKLLDDCGGAIASGSVIASFSSGDAPIVLDSDQAGGYTGTWQPSTTAASATVRLDGAYSQLQPSRLEVTGGVTANNLPVPALAPGGFLNNLNPVIGGGLAPGTATQVVGDNLAVQPAVPSAVPLPLVFQGVEVLIGGLDAPIYSTSTNQVNVQVPFELTPNRLYSALLLTDSGYSLPVSVPVVPVQPGMVTSNGGVLAQHADFSFVTAASPAKPGEVISLYLVGMGATTPAVASGNVAPAAPPAIVQTTAQVTLDSQQAEVVFQGLAPGSIGLYRVDFRVPPSAHAGNLDLVVIQDTVSSNHATLPVAAP